MAWPIPPAGATSSSISSRALEGKLALVTGSARGIGAAIIRNLAAKGANVIINHVTDNSALPATQLANEISSAHHIRAIVVQADISIEDDVDRIIAPAKAAFSPLIIDILIHNAIQVHLGLLETVTPETFHANYSMNVLGPILVTAACKPFFPTDRSGRIITISSVSPKLGTPGTTLYSGAKGAIETMTRVWARELAEQCTVNCINPGPVVTEPYFNAPEETKKWLALYNPLTPLCGVREWDDPQVQELGRLYGGRPAYPEEIAGLVASICGKEFGWCTGSLISANGGQVFSM